MKATHNVFFTSEPNIQVQARQYWNEDTKKHTYEKES